MKNRHETNLDQFRALLEVWRMVGFDDAYRLLLDTEKIVRREREWYEHFNRKPRAEKPRWRVRLAMWLLRRDRARFWARTWFRATRCARKARA